MPMPTETSRSEPRSRAASSLEPAGRGRRAPRGPGRPEASARSSPSVERSSASSSGGMSISRGRAARGALESLQQLVDGVDLALLGEHAGPLELVDERGEIDPGAVRHVRGRGEQPERREAERGDRAELDDVSGRFALRDLLRGDLGRLRAARRGRPPRRRSGGRSSPSPRRGATGGRSGGGAPARSRGGAPPSVPTSARIARSGSEIAYQRRFAGFRYGGDMTNATIHTTHGPSSSSSSTRTLRRRSRTSRSSRVTASTTASRSTGSSPTS